MGDTRASCTSQRHFALGPLLHKFWGRDHHQRLSSSIVRRNMHSRDQCLVKRCVGFLQRVRDAPPSKFMLEGIKITVLTRVHRSRFIPVRGALRRVLPYAPRTKVYYSISEVRRLSLSLTSHIRQKPASRDKGAPLRATIYRGPCLCRPMQAYLQIETLRSINEPITGDFPFSQGLVRRI